MIRLVVVMFLSVMWLGSGLPTPANADDAVPASVVSDTTWFDAQTGTLRPLPTASEPVDSANRDSRWLPDAVKVRKSSGTVPVTGTPPQSGHLAAWIVLVVLAVVIVGLIVYSLRHAEIVLFQSAAGHSGKGSPDDAMVARMRELPLELQRTDVHPRDEAQRLMELGQFDSAIVLLFGHQLLALDRQGVLRLARGKTNGRYVRETRSRDPEIAAALAQTVDAFERSYFGKHSLSAVEFRQLWQNNLQIEAMIRRISGVAA